ncbi:MAG: hypothetical protein LUG89_03685 [Methanosphaera sp.]|nr:hypothetical protein [Methanosphaera sp.]
MKLNILQQIVIVVILVGICYGTYSATIDQLPDESGTIIGNTTTNNSTDGSIGTVYLQTDDANMSIIITNSTKIYKESNGKEVNSSMEALTKGSKIDVYTIGKPTDTIPQQITSEKIVIREE